MSEKAEILTVSPHLEGSRSSQGSECSEGRYVGLSNVNFVRFSSYWQQFKKLLTIEG